MLSVYVNEGIYQGTSENDLQLSFLKCPGKWFHFINQRQSLQTNDINPIALRKAKIVYNFGLSECNMVNMG